MGGGHQFYVGDARDPNSPVLPINANGTDMSAVLGVLMAHYQHYLEEFKVFRDSGKTIETDINKMNAELARLPDKPDGTLR